MSLFRTLGELQEEFEQELGEVISREMGEDRERATESLRAKLDEIGEFISQNIQIPKSHPFVGEVIEVEKIEVVDIDHVLTTYHREGEATNISFVAAIRAHVLLDTSPYAFFRSALTANAGNTEGRPLDEQAKVVQHVLKYSVEVEATADYQFENAEYLSAHIKSY